MELKKQSSAALSTPHRPFNNVANLFFPKEPILN